MKKLLTGIVSLALAATMSVPAFAANTATNDGTAGSDITVNGKYQAGAAAADVISVDIAWDAMDFTYTAPSKGTWNAQTHQYDNPVAGGWAWNGATEEKTAPVITLANHSNVDVEASFAFNEAIKGLDGRFTKTTLVLDSAVDTEFANAPKGETAFSVSGSAIDKDDTLGTITVTVGKLPKMISTADELLATADKVGVFMLADNIDLGSEYLNITSDRYILDLNGHTLTTLSAYTVSVEEGATLTVKNGSLTNTNGEVLNNAGGTVTVDGCTLTSGNDSYVISSRGKMSVKDSVLHGVFAETFSVMVENVNASNGKYSELMFSGNVEMDGTINAIKFMDPVAPTVKALEGTYNFDVSSYVDAALYDVTKDGTTWTVTAK